MARKALIHKNTNQTTNNGGVISPKLPDVGTLQKGEIAVNYKNGYETLSIENDAGEIVPFASLEQIIAYTDTTISNKKYAGSTSDGGTANKAASIPFGSVDSTSTATAFTANVDGITELRDGVSLYLKNTVITSAAASTAPKCWTLNINNLGAKPVYVTTEAATYSTTHFTKNYKMLFTYDESLNSGNGGWYIGQLFNTNTTYSDMTQAEITAGTGTTGRKITPKMLRNNFYTEDEVDDLLGSKANSNDLATVATSGDYNDLTNRPVSIVSSVNGQTGAVTLSIPDDNNLVHITGPETIEGDKWFTSFHISTSGTGDIKGTVTIDDMGGNGKIILTGDDDAWSQIQSGNETLQQALNARNNLVTSVNGMTGAVTIENQLSNDYSPSTLINEDLVLESGDTYEEAFGKLEKLINDNEKITAAALTDLDERIPSEVTESTVSGWGFTKNTGTYSKPSGGIPASDLADAVQTSLGKADTALQLGDYYEN